jgi:hypothetical protein
MNSDWAQENLRVIRTLMERSALYRRALAPLMIVSGIFGGLGAAIGIFLPVSRPLSFILFWLGIAMVTSVAALLLVRKQALKLKEPFWSSPARRICQAVAPLLAAGLMVPPALFNSLITSNPGTTPDPIIAFVWIPGIWGILYGCAIYAAGFYTRRGIQLFGVLMAGFGMVILFWPWMNATSATGHKLMGALFAVTHLFYGGYLGVTEKSLIDRESGTLS